MSKKWILHVLLFLLFLSISYIYAYEVLNGPSQLIKYKASKAYEGYTLITSLINPEKTYLIDMLGYVVHTWEHKARPGGMNYILLENGHLLGTTGIGMMPKPQAGSDNAGTGQQPPGNSDQQAAPEGTGKLSYGGAARGLIEMDWDGNMMSGNGMFRAHRYGPDYPGLKGKDLTPATQIADDIKKAWQPRVDLEGATQPGAKLWKELWKQIEPL